MQVHQPMKLLFIINKGSGKNDNDWQTLIRNHFDALPHTSILFDLPESCNPDDIATQITEARPDRVVAVGGDGTVKLVAQACIKANLPLAILPGGSANGMAKELNIPTKPEDAFKNVVEGVSKKIHLTEVNDELCIHLADMGFNAYVIKKFESYDSRGMWGYVKAAWSVLRSHHQMEVRIKTDGETKQRSAAMVVIANATMYGTGALINPDGSLEDELFEIIVVKKVSFSEIFKMIFTHQPYDPAKTEVYQTSEVAIKSKKKVHFQIDGEYLGKVNNITARIVPQALEIIVPKA